MVNKQKHLIVISLDGLGAADIVDSIQFMPNLGKLIHDGTHIKNVRGVYPSLSYPSHTTMVTGQYPDAHGIINNTKFNPNKKNKDWFFSASAIKSTTLMRLAAKKGLTVASLMWPVTLGSPDIDINVSPVFNNNLWNQPKGKVFSASPASYALGVNSRFKKYKGAVQPDLDQFVVKETTKLIKEKKPNLLLVHLTDLDSHRHRFGVHSIEANDALLRIDQHLEKIIKATREADIYNDTVFAIVSDHYLLDVQQMVHLNMLFEQKDWLTVNLEHQIMPNWQVISNASGGSASVYVKDERKINQVIDSIVRSPISSSIEKIYYQREIKSTGADNKASFIIEARAGFYFTDEVDRAHIVVPVEKREIGLDNRFAAAHGYHPDKPMYTSTMILSGNGISKNHEIWQTEMINIAPTLAEILDLKFKNKIEGQIIPDIINKTKTEKPGILSRVKQVLYVSETAEVKPKHKKKKTK